MLVEAVVLFLSSRPNLHLPGAVPNLDKLAHFVEYAVVGGVLFRALRLSGAGGIAAAAGTVALVCGLGAGDEWLQSGVPGRESGAPDWLADTAGGIAGAGSARWLERRLPLRIWSLGAKPARDDAAGSNGSRG